MGTQYGLDIDGNVTSNRADVARVDGHETMYSLARGAWTRHVYGPGGAEMACDAQDVPAVIRAADLVDALESGRADIYTTLPGGQIELNEHGCALCELHGIRVNVDSYGCAYAPDHLVR